MNSPLISIIVPVFNTSSYLESCFSSIRRQTFENFEVIVVNDGSTDDSGDKCIAEVRKDSRFHYFEQENLGQSSARKLGLENSRGKYICFLDSDDEVTPFYLDGLYNLIKEGKSELGVCSFLLLEDKTNKLSLFVDEKNSGVVDYLEMAKSVLSIHGSQPGLANGGYLHNKIFLREIFLTLSTPSKKYAEDELLCFDYLSKIK